MRGDPDPICWYCGDYCPDGEWRYQIDAWACDVCMYTPKTRPEVTDAEVRAAIKSIKEAQ